MKFAWPIDLFVIGYLIFTRNTEPMFHLVIVQKWMLKN